MKVQRPIIATAIVLVFSVAGVWAQSPTPQETPSTSGETSPKQDNGAYPAARGVSGPSVDAPYVTPEVTPDSHALSGAENFTIGSLGAARNIVDVGLYATEYGYTSSNGTESVTDLGGNLNLNRTWNRSRFSVFYNGQAALGSNVSGNNSWYQDLSAEQMVHLGRLALTFRNDFVATPQSMFGGQALGGPGALGQFSPTSAISLGTINPAFGSTGSILTGQTMRIMNTSIGEADYSVSRRTVITFAGSYGFFHFLSSGYIDSRQITGQVGYNYALSPLSTLALIGSYSHIRFIGNTFAIDNGSVQVAYGRKVTGRMAVQVSGGPMSVRTSDPNAGTATSLSWIVNGALSYQYNRRTGYSLSYSHETTAGSGVFYGSQSHIFTANVHRTLSRFWQMNVNGGYTQNNSLVTSALVTNQFDGWYAGANLSHQIGRVLSVTLNYGIQKQLAYGGSTCPVAGCGSNALTHYFGATLSWHSRPFLVE